MESARIPPAVFNTDTQKGSDADHGIDHARMIVVQYPRGDNMPIVYSINVLEELKKAGYNTGALSKNKILGGSTLQYLREDKLISMKSLETICKLLDRQPGEIIEYVNLGD